jgi:NAD(P)-dependent dehydrogenase (short-subunit alcohol dehydrogenase family)
MDLGLKGRRVLVTGGTKGIGFACAEAFAAEGCAVVLTGRTAEGVGEAVAKLAAQHCEATGFIGDLARAEDRQRLAAEHGDVDILVNNAGAIPGGGLLDLTMERWEEAWSLKVMGYIHLTQLFLDRMKGRGAGIIANIIGAGGRSPRYEYVCGATGNAALMAFTGAVGGRSVDWGVRVFAVNPSSTRTERAVSLAKTNAKLRFGDEWRWEETLAGLPLGRPAEPEEIARTTVFLASPACGYASGATFDIDAGTAFRG